MRDVQIIGAGSSFNIANAVADNLRHYGHNVVVIRMNEPFDCPSVVEEIRNKKDLSYQKFTKPYGHKR